MSKKNGKKGFFTQFKEFITKGNVLDLAVGVIIGNAFKAIVTALTEKILMPVITYAMGDQSISELKYVLKDRVPEKLADDGVTVVTPEVPENAIYYGEFIQSIIDFLLIALVLFVIVKAAMTFHDKREALAKKMAKEEEEKATAEEAPAEPTIEEKNAEVLKEIRDLLAKNVKQ